MPDEQVIEPVVEQAPETPSYSDRVDALTGDARAHYRITGDVDAAEALLKPKSDVTAESSTASAAPSKEDVAGTEPEPEPGAQEPEQLGKPGRPRNEALAQLRKALADAKSEIEQLKGQSTDSGKSAPAAEVVVPSTQEIKRPEFPDIAKFETIDDYNKAVGKYHADLESYNDWKIEQRFNQEKQGERQAQTEKQWQSQNEASRKLHPDFDAVAYSDKTPASDAMIKFIQRQPNGTELLYWFGKNPKEAERIANLTHVPDLAELAKTNPARAAYLFGQAEGKAEAEISRIQLTKPAVQKETARLPKPSGEVAVTPKGAPVEDEESAIIASGDTDAYKRFVNAREMAARRR